MYSQNLNPGWSADDERPGFNYQHQYLPDLSLVHDMFVDIWFKHIRYYAAHSGQLPEENLNFIDGLNFVECCFLKQEMDLMCDVVAGHLEQSPNKSRDFHILGVDISAQLSAFMNYIDQRLTTLNHLQGLMNQNFLFANKPVYFREARQD